MTSLSAEERETHITMDDAGDFALITTYQRPWLTALEKNPSAELLEELSALGTKGAIYKVPKVLISKPRAARRKASPGAADRMEKARAARGIK